MTTLMVSASLKQGVTTDKQGNGVSDITGRLVAPSPQGLGKGAERLGDREVVLVVPE